MTDSPEGHPAARTPQEPPDMLLFSPAEPRSNLTIVSDEQAVFSVSTTMQDLLGVTQTCVSLPHLLGASSASHPQLPEMNQAETAALRDSAGLLWEAIRQGLAGSGG